MTIGAEYTSLTGSYIINGISGIWNSYGCPVNQNDGLTLSLEETETGTTDAEPLPNNKRNEFITRNNQKSLIRLLNFDKSKKQIGALKKSKKIYELVVMLPMFEKQKIYSEAPTEPEYTEPADPCAPCDEKVDPCSFPFEPSAKQFEYFYGHKDDANAIDPEQMGLVYCMTEDAWLFIIKEDIINKILNTTDYKELSIQTITEILNSRKDLNKSNTIVKLMFAMIKYNFPPHLNWLLFPKIVPPYAMYAVEFSSNLNKHDLSNIWQGTMPTQTQAAEEEEIVLEHFLNVR